MSVGGYRAITIAIEPERTKDKKTSFGGLPVPIAVNEENGTAK